MFVPGTGTQSLNHSRSRISGVWPLTDCILLTYYSKLLSVNSNVSNRLKYVFCIIYPSLHVGILGDYDKQHQHPGISCLIRLGFKVKFGSQLFTVPCRLYLANEVEVVNYFLKWVSTGRTTLLLLNLSWQPKCCGILQELNLCLHFPRVCKLNFKMRTKSVDK